MRVCKMQSYDQWKKGPIFCEVFSHTIINKEREKNTYRVCNCGAFGFQCLYFSRGPVAVQKKFNTLLLFTRQFLGSCQPHGNMPRAVRCCCKGNGTATATAPILFIIY